MPTVRRCTDGSRLFIDKLKANGCLFTKARSCAVALFTQYKKPTGACDKSFARDHVSQAGIYLNHQPERNPGKR